MIKKLDHVGVIVRELEPIRQIFTALFGANSGPVHAIPQRGVRIVFLDLGGTSIELIEPLEEGFVFADFLKERGPGVHHIGLEVDDIEAALRQVAEGGLELIDQQPRRPLPDRLVAHFWPSADHSIRCELVQYISAEAP